MVGAGLPATEGNVRLLDPVEIKIGTVRPFEVNTAEASNLIDSGRRLNVWFSKDLSKEVTVKNVSRWATWSPCRPTWK